MKYKKLNAIDSLFKKFGVTTRHARKVREHNSALCAAHRKAVYEKHKAAEAERKRNIAASNYDLMSDRQREAWRNGDPMWKTM